MAIQTEAHALADIEAQVSPAPLMAGAPGYGDDLIVAAARCWRAARDQGAPAQQQLYGLLAPHDRALLAPVFHSLMTLWQASLGRNFATGDCEFSADERRLLDALNKGEPMWEGALLACPPALRSPLQSALTCTRIMIASIEAPGTGRLSAAPGATRSANEH